MAEFAELSKLREHEEILPEHFEELKKQVVSDGMLKKPIAVDKNTSIILDGHHRFNIIKSLGMTKIPVIFVDYNSSEIIMRPYREGEKVTKKMVLEKVSKGLKFPPRTTKHFVNISGELKHISEIEKEVNVPLQELK